MSSKKKQRRYLSFSPFSLLSTLSFILFTFYPSLFASSGASFLKIPVGARAVGMGSAYTAIANDLTALYWNPAGLSGVHKKELGFMHAELFADTRYEFIGFAMPIKTETRDQRPAASQQQGNSKSSIWSFGMGVIYLSQGAIESRDENRKKTGEFSASDLAVHLGTSHKISKRSSLGMNLKMIRQSIESEQAKGFAADLGLLTKTPRLNLGFSLLNMGPSMKLGQEGYPLPFTVSAGVGYHLNTGLTFSFDFKHRPQDNISTFGLGSELMLLNAFSLRAGYLSSLASLQKTKESRNLLTDQFAGLGTGIGVKVFNSQIDYSFTTMGELGLSQRLSLTLRF